MNWSNESPSDTCRFKDLYDNFTENMKNHKLEQMVKIPTRNNNILDLFLTNIPSQVHEIKTLPGLGTSDHDIVFHEIKVKRGRIKHIPRQVKSYIKVNWSDFKKDLAIFTNTFIANKHKDPNHLWDIFKAEVNRLSTLHIPTRQIKSRADLPWVTHEIVKLIKKRQTVHKTEKVMFTQKSLHCPKCSNISSQPYKNRLEIHTGHT